MPLICNIESPFSYFTDFVIGTLFFSLSCTVTSSPTSTPSLQYCGYHRQAKLCGNSVYKPNCCMAYMFFIAYLVFIYHLDFFKHILSILYSLVQLINLLLTVTS